jgi:hypothetical protein
MLESRGMFLRSTVIDVGNAILSHSYALSESALFLLICILSIMAGKHIFSSFVLLIVGSFSKLFSRLLYMNEKCMAQRPRRKVIFVGISLLVVLLGSCLTLLWQSQHVQKGLADDGIVVGAPSLPAATVDAILQQNGSPMTGTGQVVAQEASQYNVDDAFALAVWYVETSDGAAGVGSADLNPGSVRGSAGYPSASDGYTIYPSYAAGIADWFQLISTRYVGSGLTSVYTIAPSYVGTSSSGSWAAKVANLMATYRGEAPPTTAGPAPTPTPQLKPFRPPLPAHKGPVISTHKPAPKSATPSVKAQPKVAQPALSIQKGSSENAAPSMNTMLTLAGSLLLALMLALWGVWLRRPGAASTTVPAAFAVTAEKWEPDAPTTEQFAFPTMQQLSFSGRPLREPDTIPAPAAVGSSNMLLLPYRFNEPGPRHITLMPYGEKPQSAGDNGVRQPATETRVPLSGMHLPTRKSEPVKVRTGGGLLQRYGKEE